MGKGQNFQTKLAKCTVGDETVLYMKLRLSRKNVGCMNLVHFRPPNFDWASNVGRALY